MKILVLGGTRFAGRHFVELCLAHGIQPELLNRSQSAPHLFSDLILHRGDRREGSFPTLQTDYDAVVDFSGYGPEDMLNLLPILRGRVRQYVYISTISVYRVGSDVLRLDENSQVLQPEDEVDAATRYGLRKLQCESLLTKAFPNALILRPGILAGPYDPTMRYTYWLQRLRSEENIAIRANPRQPLQFLDASDLAAFLLHGIDEELSGVFNLCGPLEELDFATWLSQCAYAMGLNSNLTFSGSIDVGGDREPFVLPDSQQAFFRVDTAFALGNGLVLSSHRQTLLEVLKWLEY